MKLILASGSPRRRELLEVLGHPFTVEAAEIDETIDTRGDLRKEIEKLSYRKALPVFTKHPEAIVIGADTIVTLDGEILGKPKTAETAEAMLHKLQGRTHEVITGVSILSAEKSESFSVTSRVTFFPMDEEEIREYAASGEAFDKAGAYGIQGSASRFIEKIMGDYYAIMGLPVSALYERLKAYPL